MDDLLAEHGEGWMLDLLVAGVSEGEKPWEIVQRLGLVYSAVKKWLEDEPSRMDALELAHRCFADKLSYQELEEAALATTDDVALRKFRADVWGRKAKQLDRQRYGDKVEVTHKAVPVLNIVTAVLVEEELVEALPVEVEDAGPIDG